MPSPAHRLDERRLSGTPARELVRRRRERVASREGFPLRRPDGRRLSRWWLALFSVVLVGRDAFESLVEPFPVALAGREAFESLVVGVVLRRVVRRRGV